MDVVVERQGLAIHRGRELSHGRRLDCLRGLRQIIRRWGGQGAALPVNADLENGYADAPERVAETIRRAAKAGAVGASIEDFTGDPQRGIYDFQHARAGASGG